MLVRRFCVVISMLPALYGAEVPTRLPLDISTFATLRQGDYTYIDKTQYAYDLITGAGRRYFLSRPRRFGKSLFVATLKEILQGNRQLFDNLWIDDSDYDWAPHGVILLDLSALGIDNLASLKEGLVHALSHIARRYHLDILPTAQPELLLHDMVCQLRDRFGKVAVLIDEYDAPLLALLDDATQFKQVRDGLRRFFAAIKSMDSLIDFVFITGISACGQTSLFSGMNNVRVLTMQPEYSALCGYTADEVDTYLRSYIQEWADQDSVPYPELMEQLQAWYGGYRMSLHGPCVYNPYSLMHALEHRACHHFWFQSGTPTFLIDRLKSAMAQDARHYLETLMQSGTCDCSAQALHMFDLEHAQVPALMLQTGYLTLKSYNSDTSVYTLGYPNQEVGPLMQQYILSVCAHQEADRTQQLAYGLRHALIQEDISQVVILLRHLFAHIPYQLHMPEEKFYHAIVQAACTVAGLRAQSEYSTSHARADLVIELPELIYIIEMKAQTSPHTALQQIKDRRYYELFVHTHKPIWLVGMSFYRGASTFDIQYQAQKIVPPDYAIS